MLALTLIFIILVGIGLGGWLLYRRDRKAFAQTPQVRPFETLAEHNIRTNVPRPIPVRHVTPARIQAAYQAAGDELYEERRYRQNADTSLLTTAAIITSIADTAPSYTPDTSSFSGGESGGAGASASWDSGSSSSYDSGSSYSDSGSSFGGDSGGGSFGD